MHIRSYYYIQNSCGNEAGADYGLLHICLGTLYMYIASQHHIHLHYHNYNTQSPLRAVHSGS